MGWLLILLLALHGTLGYLLFEAFKEKKEWRY